MNPHIYHLPLFRKLSDFNGEEISRTMVETASNYKSDQIFSGRMANGKNKPIGSGLAFCYVQVATRVRARHNRKSQRHLLPGNTRPNHVAHHPASHGEQLIDSLAGFSFWLRYQLPSPLRYLSCCPLNPLTHTSLHKMHFPLWKGNLYAVRAEGFEQRAV